MGPVTDPDRPTWAQAEQPPVLEDAVVRLRPLRVEDKPAVLAAVADPQMVRWTTIPDPYTAQQADDWVDREAPGGWQAGRNPVWAIADPATDDYLGGIDLRLDGEGMAEVGYAVAPWARGRGVATHALALACRWGFEVVGLEVIFWLAFAGNEASRRTAERVGFQVLDGVARKAAVQRGRRLDAWVGDLLPEDLRVPL